MDISKHWRPLPVAIVIQSLLIALPVYALDAPPLKGAIFTTTPDGVVVNENVHYEDKTEVYLIGGPGPNAPNSAAALPDGWYYFQITEPAGKCLLSSKPGYDGVDGGTCKGSKFEAEPLECRKFKVEGGLITMVDGSSHLYMSGHGKNTNYVDCTHDAQTDDNGGLVVGMFPFADTPNPGGVYKAWAAPVDDVRRACPPIDGSGDQEEPTSDYLGVQTGETCEGNFGFIHAESKTDNFKVRENRLFAWPIATRAFHDRNLDCEFNVGTDELIIDWQYAIHEPFAADLQIRNSNFLGTTTANEPDEEEVLTFDVIGRQHWLWAEDQKNRVPYSGAFIGQSEDSTILNTPNSITTFGDLKDFAAFDSDLSGHAAAQTHVWFALPFACNYPDPRLSGQLTFDSDSDSDLTDGEKDVSTNPGESDGIVGGFVPSDWVAETFKEGIVYRKNDAMPEPLLTLSMGSVGIAKVKACKFFDQSGDGVQDSTESPIENWSITLRVPASVPIPDTISLPSGTACNYPQNSDLYTQLVNEYGAISEMCDRVITQTTGSDGCTTFRLLLPNDLNYENDFYTIEEVIPPYWQATTESYYTFDVRSVLIYNTPDSGNDPADPSGPDVRGVTLADGIDNDGLLKPSDYEYQYVHEDNFAFVFGNKCTLPPVDFGTKGFWHNKNGLAILNGAPSFIELVNTLAPYTARHTPDYFNGNVPWSGNDVGDEPFDGVNESYALVPAAYNNDNVTEGLTAGEGTALAEISHFLVNKNSDGGIREQLAQQLLAFLFNVHYQAGASLACDSATYCYNAPAINIDGGPVVDSNALINEALAAWAEGTDSERMGAIKGLLDYWNNQDSVFIVPDLATCLAERPIH